MDLKCEKCGRPVRVRPEEQEAIFSCWQNAGYTGAVRQDCITCRENNSCSWIPVGEVLCVECTE